MEINININALRKLGHKYFDEKGNYTISKMKDYLLEDLSLIKDVETFVRTKDINRVHIISHKVNNNNWFYTIVTKKMHYIVNSPKMTKDVIKLSKIGVDYNDEKEVIKFKSFLLYGLLCVSLILIALEKIPE